jgi:hypothetical protein
VAGLSGLMAAAVRLATAARGAGNRAGAQVAELSDLLSERIAMAL